MNLRQSSYKVKIVGSGGQAFMNESNIYFETDNLHIFIQTDKSRYSAGQEGKLFSSLPLNIPTAINDASPKVHDVVFVFLTKGII